MPSASENRNSIGKITLGGKRKTPKVSAPKRVGVAGDQLICFDQHNHHQYDPSGTQDAMTGLMHKNSLAYFTPSNNNMMMMVPHGEAACARPVISTMVGMTEALPKRLLQTMAGDSSEDPSKKVQILLVFLIL